MLPVVETEERSAVADKTRASLPTTVARFEIRHSRFLNAKGEAVRPLPDFARDRAALVALYRAMVLARSFDAKAVALQRTCRYRKSHPGWRRFVDRVISCPNVQGSHVLQCAARVDAGITRLA